MGNKRPVAMRQHQPRHHSGRRMALIKQSARKLRVMVHHKRLPNKKRLQTVMSVKRTQLKQRSNGTASVNQMASAPTLRAAKRSRQLGQTCGEYSIPNRRKRRRKQKRKQTQREEEERRMRRRHKAEEEESSERKKSEEISRHKWQRFNAKQQQDITI